MELCLYLFRRLYAIDPLYKYLLLDNFPYPVD